MVIRLFQYQLSATLSIEIGIQAYTTGQCWYFKENISILKNEESSILATVETTLMLF